MSEIKRLTRNYEISVWTLQDSFITVLGASQDKYKGRIQNPEMTLVNDGTQELDFSIPMYLDDGITRDLNPIWQDINNAAVIAGMRKIKVIFNKATDVERIFEFLITKVTKTHENDKPECNVHCEGLAFHELGKVGYKIEFSTDVLTAASYEWSKKRPKYYIGTAPETVEEDDDDDEEINRIQYFATEQEWQAAEDEWAASEPLSTLDYWVHDVMGIEKYPESSTPNATQWYYKVEMDWSDYSNVADIPRDNNKVYDEEYVTSWNIDLLPSGADSIQSYKEKTRVLDEKESNIYNLTQKLAETFGIFCRYDYGYDDNYHINSRTIVFYNHAINDKVRNFSFTYPYSSTKITREDDCTDIVTKMFVTAVEDSSTESGLVTIMNSKANPTGEDYVMNFDYLHDIETISDEQYDAIHDFEVAIRAINDQLQPLNDRLMVKQDRLPKAQAAKTIAKDAMTLDVERRDNCKRLRKALDEDDGKQDGYITVDGANADIAILSPYEAQPGTYYIRQVPKDGIDPGSFKIYKTMDYTTNTLSNQINSGRAEYDEFGNLTSWILIDGIADSSDLRVYLTYRYSLTSYYEKVEEAWNKRYDKDKSDYQKYSNEIYKLDETTGIETGLKVEIENLKNQIQTLLDQKSQLIKDFEKMMGPALREGYWTPQNYDTRTGEKYTDFIKFDQQLLSNEFRGTTEYASFVWDSKLFDEEQDIYYERGIEQTKVYYPFIELTNAQWAFIREHKNDPVGILYYNYIHNEVQQHEPKYLQCLAIGASAQLAFVQYNDLVHFGLLITGESLTTEEMEYLQTYSKGGACIGYLTTEVVNNLLTISAETGGAIIDTQWKNLDSNCSIVYPRIKINSLSLKRGETDLILSYNYQELEEYEDYYIFSRVDTTANETEYLGSSYYITLKPSVVVYADPINNTLPLKGYIGIRYSISNASTAVYLDSLEVIKENSKPKVTYSLDPNILQENFTYTAYNTLNTIAFINDYELQFDGAQGYISNIKLNLDYPNQDTVEVKNYKNKFEDLFSTIVAQTQAMEKNEATITAMTKVISTDGSITAPALAGALRKVDLNYSFNQGKLTISESNGIWGTSDDGVVAFRGGGIFTATQKDDSGSWQWNTGIVPQGINANAITAGQIDTNKITIYSGDRIRFQFNSEGLYSYKSLFSDYDVKSTNIKSATAYTALLNENKTGDADLAQYVVMNEDGLFLVAKKGSYVVFNNNGAKDIKILGDGVANFPDKLKRVEISWDGLILKNWDNEKVFFADAETGNLNIKGKLTATELYITVDEGIDIGNNTTTTEPDILSYLNAKGLNKLAQVEVDQSTGKINLSSLGFDSKGIKSSQVEIVPSGITVKSSGSITMNSSTLSMTSSNISMTGGNISLTGNNSITLTSNDSVVSITPTELKLGSGAIKIKNSQGEWERIWERSDIIYSTTFPSTHPTDRPWLWVKPVGNSSVTYGSPSNTQGDGYLFSADSLVWAEGDITMTVTVTFALTAAGDAVNNISFYLSINGYVLSNNDVSVNIPKGGSGAPNTSDGKLYYTITNPSTNPFNTTVIPYHWGLNYNYYKPHVITSLSVAVSVPATTANSGSECRVFYYTK